MEESNYEPAYEEYPDYPEQEGLGLPPSQLALIIGVNAVISLLISVSVVLLINWRTAPTAPVGAPPEAAVASATAQSVEIGGEPNAQTTPDTIIYKVQAGDSLSLIATKFSVPLYDLMVANNLTNENFIQVDQQLIIPVGGLPTPTPTFTAVPATPTEVIAFEPPTPLPTETPASGGPVDEGGAQPMATETTPPQAEATPTETSTPAEFTGIIVDITEVVEAGNIDQERLSIFNQGVGTSLKNWTLEGSPIGTFSFPDIFIFSGGTIRIHTKAGQSTPSDLYLGQSESAWPAGTAIILRDKDGLEISRYTIP
ncbi:LysM peptidoglycan-binding domain-containing protein [Anaerolineales bacterium HSG6]|nr:LysM peptidoglycan-binding domain-containing protein [Anaerolineales bacterium HSG6]MDM8532483.1 LysM peptidoglycan-binding domain-containing protein [Anaerolineales bacterium HSG25]